MNTELEMLLFETQQEAQRLLNVNDPGYTIVMSEDRSRATVYDPAGVVYATIDAKGIHKKVLL